ncbi:hypothetical protein AgCh_017140 [Apium graveolens]
MCPGYNLGLKVVTSILGNLLHGFNWKLPDNMKNEDLSMDEVYGLEYNDVQQGKTAAKSLGVMLNYVLAHPEEDMFRY